MNTLRHDDGAPMSLKQVCDLAWEQFGIAAIIAELSGRLAWNARYECPERAEAISKDAESLAMIAERLERWTEQDAVA